MAVDGFDFMAPLGRPQIQDEMIGYKLTLISEPTIGYRDYQGLEAPVFSSISTNNGRTHA